MVVVENMYKVHREFIGYCTIDKHVTFQAEKEAMAGQYMNSASHMHIQGWGWGWKWEFWGVCVA